MATLSDNQSMELVVARHEEDLRWLRRVPTSFRISIYNKGSAQALPQSLLGRAGISVISLPNIGREAHTYLTHLITRFDSLAAVTVFCQGHPFDHAPDLHCRLNALAEKVETPDPFLWYGFLEDTDDPQGRRLFVPWSKNHAQAELSTGKLYELLFESPSPDLFHFRGGAQFAVSREGVRSRSSEFYQRALEACLSDPLTPHSLERFWDRFFGDPVVDPATLGHNGTRYLKKIRRLEPGGKIVGSVDSV
ncbi:MAG: DUF3431 domain-containing protein [Verrucomicrobiota bacterium]